MKSLLWILFINLLFCSCKNTSNKAVEYNNSIVEEQKQLAVLFDSLHSAFENMNTSAIDMYYNKAFLQAGLAIENIKKMPPFEQDSSLKMKALALFNEYHSVLKNELNDIAKEFKSNLAYYTPKKEEKLRTVFAEIDNRLTLAAAEFQRAQKAFAAQYGFDFEK